VEDGKLAGSSKRAENIAEIAKRIADMLGHDRPVSLDVPLKERARSGIGSAAEVCKRVKIGMD